MVIPVFAPVNLVGTGSTFDPATTAWVNQVIINGGTVSGTEKGYVDTLIKGLKSDGIWTKLDRLWLFASENTAQALTDIVADSLATAVNSPTFTANAGYTGDGTATYIDSNVNPATAGGNLAVNSACFFAWNNTSGAGNNTAILGGSNTNVSDRIDPGDGSGNCLWNIQAFNGGVSETTFASSGATGLYLACRTGATAATIDLNGVQKANDTTTASDGFIQSTDLVALKGGGGVTSRQVSCFGFGGALNGTDRANIYTRLRTYMTSVGVP